MTGHERVYFEALEGEMAEFYWFLAAEQFQPEVVVKHAQAAEAAGFDGVLISEHFHPWVDDLGTAGFTFATLGAIAAVTTKLKMATAVTAPLFRFHPAVVAQAAATIDRLSGGRFALGVGSGELINEGPLGYTLPAYAERSARLAEALEIMHRLLAGEKLSFNGQFYTTQDAKLYSPPLGKLPIYLAAAAPKSAALAGTMAEGLITSVKVPADTIQKVIEPARAAAGDRPLTVVATHWSVYAHSDEEAWEALLPQRGLRAPSRADTHDPKKLQTEADSLPHADVLSKYSRLATSDDYVATYGPLVSELGADIVGIQTTSTNQLDLIAKLGREALPELRKLSSPAKL